jgi:hypothetical protein
MTPDATVVHHIAGRTRFRIHAARGNREYFSRLGDHLAKCPGVESIMTNVVTGSVLVLHDAAEPDVLAAYARTFELFEVKDEAVRAVEGGRPSAAVLTRRIERIDQWVRAETGEATDLRSVALTSLIAAAIWQLLRGNTLPAAGTLVWYALSLASNGPIPTGGSRKTPPLDEDADEEIHSRQ